MSDITLEQINDAFENNPDLKGQFIENFRGSEDGQALLNNYAQNHWDSKIGDEIGSLHGKYDDDFSEVLGIKKPDGVKSYIFWKEQVQKLKEGSDPELIATKDAEIARLQKAIESNAGSEHFKTMYEKLPGESESRVSELNAELEALKGQIRSGKIESLINKAMSGFEFNSDLPEEVRSSYIDGIVSKLIEGAKVMEDGTVTFYENNEPILDSKTLAKMDAGAILKSKFASILAKKETTNGGGVDPNKVDPANPNRLGASGSIASAKTQVQLNDAIKTELIGKGLKKGSAEYSKEADALFAEYSKGLPIQ